MNNVWVLVCDAARARVFAVSEEAPWHQLEAFHHDESRNKDSELVSDRAGRSSARGGSVHHNALSPSSAPKELESEHFVQTLTAFLEQGVDAHRFHRWVLVAPPHFLGLVKGALSSELQKRLLATMDKDLSALPSEELAARLHETVRIPPDQREVLRGPVKHTH
jgi:protein required for attachment to host cells